MFDWLILITIILSPSSRSFSSLSDDSEEARARYLYRQWVGLGLTDVHLSNHTVLLSQPGSTPNTITDRSSHQCFLPNGIPCDQRGPSDLLKQQFSYAAYSAVGTLQVLVYTAILTFPKSKVVSPSWQLQTPPGLPHPHHHHTVTLPKSPAPGR